MEQSSNTNKDVNTTTTVYELTRRGVTVPSGISEDEAIHLKKIVNRINERGIKVVEIDMNSVKVIGGDGKEHTISLEEMKKAEEDAKKAEERLRRDIRMDWEGNVMTKDMLEEKLKQEREEQE